MFRRHNLFNSRKTSSYLLGLCLALLITACSTPNPEPPKEASNLELTIVAADNVNPNEARRPSPIQVRIFELKGDSTFKEGDFFTLMGNEKTALAGDLLAKEEFILRPGESKVIKRKANPNTTVIGILAGYYDLPTAVWREQIKLEPSPEAAWWRMVVPSNKVKTRIELQSQGIVLIPEK